MDNDQSDVLDGAAFLLLMALPRQWLLHLMTLSLALAWSASLASLISGAMFVVVYWATPLGLCGIQGVLVGTVGCRVSWYWTPRFREHRTNLLEAIRSLPSNS